MNHAIVVWILKMLLLIIMDGLNVNVIGEEEQGLTTALLYIGVTVPRIEDE